MTAWLIRFFIKNSDQTETPSVRMAYGTVGSITGIVVNLFLSCAKFLLGVISGSLAITADAVNNLSDAGGSIVSLVSVRMAQKPTDREHPFGHGRMEYIGALTVGVLIVTMGLGLFREGVTAIFHPEPLTDNLWVPILLGISILFKLWLFYFYRKLGKRIDSLPLLAASKDSLSDVVATSAVLASILLHAAFDWIIDGYIGIAVAGFVLKSGIEVCRDTVDSLLGQKPDPDKIRAIKTLLLNYDGILGVHDLVLHDYGPGRCIASVHAEVSAKGDILEIHELIDKAEREIADQLKMAICIHMDPIVTDDEQTNQMYFSIAEFLRKTDERITIHDFRVVPGQHQINLIFDCVLPADFKQQEQLHTETLSFVKSIDPRYEIVVQYDMDYT